MMSALKTQTHPMMVCTKLVVIFLLISSFCLGQDLNTTWYSELTTDGITIQNSYPKGGAYSGPVKEHFNYSYLVFHSRLINNSGEPFELNVNFSGDPVPIPNAPYTYLKLFLPSEEMTLEKQSLLSYGITELKSLDEPTSFRKKLQNKEECRFYVVAIFYQIDKHAPYEDRGGNRAEFFLDGQKLVFRMKPQIESLDCGSIRFDK